MSQPFLKPLAQSYGVPDFFTTNTDTQQLSFSVAYHKVAIWIGMVVLNSYTTLIQIVMKVMISLSSSLAGIRYAHYEILTEIT